MAVGLTSNATGAGFMLAVYYDRKFLDNLYPDLYLWQFGDKKRVPSRSGKVVHWRRITKLTEALGGGAGALTEGTPITPGVMSATAVSATLVGYGASVIHSDFLVMTAMNDVVADSVHECAKVLALKIEGIIEGMLSTKGTLDGASALGITAVQDTSGIFATDIINNVTTLRAADAKTFPDGNFVGRFHPNQIHNLQTDAVAGGWRDINKYATNETVGKLYRGEIGQLYGVRCIMSSNVPVIAAAAANTAALHTGMSGRQAYIFGPGAYGVTELEGGGAKTYIKQLGSAGTADPINQNATVGAKIYFAPADLDTTNRLIRLISGYALA